MAFCLRRFSTLKYNFNSEMSVFKPAANNLGQITDLKKISQNVITAISASATVAVIYKKNDKYKGSGIH